MTREELQAQTPSEVLAAYPDVPWRLADLHRLALEVVPVPIEDLRWMFGLPLWQLNGLRFQVPPAAVAANPAEYPHHYRRVMAADLAYPIHCTSHRSRLVVLDGIHRLLQASIRGHDVIQAKLLTAAHLTAISAKR